ncbi:response regulator [Microseira wollei]
MVVKNLATRHTQAFNLLRSMRILLLEDNDINRQLLSEYLIYLGYQVLGLADGCNLFQALSDFQPQLILLDLKLPGIDGYTILEQIQQSSDWHQVPVIVVSAFAFRADQQRAINLGARRYFVKPVKLPQLKQAIQEELKKGSAQ